MATAARGGGGAEGDRRTTGFADSIPSAAATQVAIPDLRILRDRLVGARRRLLERIAEDFPADRRFPDSGWTRMLADIQVAIMAVDAVVEEGGP